MKIIELGRCIDVNDPLGVGRIRVEYLEKNNSSQERSVDEYKPWSDVDPFLFNPFLPQHINIVPKKNQLVKLFFWETENHSLTREYIPGPYVNAFDFDSQGADKQRQLTSSGVRIRKEANLLRPENGEYLDASNNGSLIKPEDLGIYGNYGSDMIMIKNGVMMRAGKYDDTRLKSTNKPVMYNKPAKFIIQKFENTVEFTDKEIISDERQHKPLSSIVEYGITNITGTTSFDGYVRLYKIITHVLNETDTYYFNQNKNVPDSNKKVVYEKNFSGLTIDQIGRDISQELRKIDMSVTHHDLNESFFKVPIHPFYYKHSKSFFDSILTRVDREKARELFSHINLGSNGSFGLSYSPVEKDVPVKKVKKILKEKKVTNKPKTIGALMSDMFFLLSYDANIPNDSEKINFSKLNNYEPTQEELIGEILPKTHALVRGEPLMELLTLIVQFLIQHVHNPAEVGIATEGLKEKMLKELQLATEKILNQKFRVN